MTTKLTPPTTTFIDNPHSYHNAMGQPLQGITGILKRHLFQDQYQNIPQHILDNAKQRGTLIHNQCQHYALFNQLPTQPREETQHYATLIEQKNIQILDAEYLVSDDTHYATMIDMIDHKHNLYDIKTTHKLNKDYLTWQLSISAYLFELQNPLLKAGKLYGIWLKEDKATLVPLKRIPTNHIKDLLQADQEGTIYQNPYQKELPKDTLPHIQQIIQTEKAIQSLKAQLQLFDQQKQTLLRTLQQTMETQEIDTWETNHIRITYVKPSQTKTIDTTKLKAEQPRLYDQYTKTTERKGYIKTTLKNQPQ